MNQKCPHCYHYDTERKGLTVDSAPEESFTYAAEQWYCKPCHQYFLVEFSATRFHNWNEVTGQWVVVIVANPKH